MAWPTPWLPQQPTKASHGLANVVAPDVKRGISPTTMSEKYERVELVHPETGDVVDTIVIDLNRRVQDLIHEIVQTYDEFLPTGEIIIRGPNGDSHLKYRDKLREN